NGPLAVDNTVSTLAAVVTGAGSSFSFVSSNGVLLNVGTVDGVTGLTTNNGDVTLTADKLAINQAISPGTAFVFLVPGSANDVINLGSTVDTTPNTLELSDAELGRIVSGTTVIGGVPSTGGIVISAAITRTPTLPNTTRSQALLLFGNNGSITQTAPLS